MDRYCARDYTFTHDAIDDQIMNCMSLNDNPYCLTNCCAELRRPYAYYRAKYGVENAEWMTNAVERIGCNVVRDKLTARERCPSE